MSKLLLQDTFFSALGAVEERVRKIEERNATIATSGGSGGGLTVGSVLDVHVASNAGIQLTKLAQDPRARSTHTGTQLANTISDFSTAATAFRLDQFAAPTAAVSLNGQKITNLGTPTVGTDATTKTYVDGEITNAKARANHTGTQLASTISNFDAQVRTSRLDQMALPTATVAFNNQSITGISSVGTSRINMAGGLELRDDGAGGFVVGNNVDGLSGQIRVAAVALDDFDGLTHRLATLVHNFAANQISLSAQRRLSNLADPTANQDAATKAYADARAGSTVVLDNVPVGTILPYGGAAAPSTDWMLCQGQSLDRTTYSSLFSAIGTAYGSADATHFTLPNLQGRVPVGAGTGTGDGASGTGTITGGTTLSGRTVGAWGGAENHTLTIGQMPSHAHTPTDPGHVHSNTNGAYLQVSATVSTFLNTTNNAGYAVFHAPNTATAFTGITIQNTGGGTSHPNVQPFVVTNYIIKVSARAPQGLMAATEAAPVGTVAPYAGATAPNADWLLCDGSAISRTTYADLFTIIGTTYGAGNGSTTFNLPDLRGRVPVGAGTGSGLSARTRGATGGEENHTLSIGEMPSHNHSGAAYVSINRAAPDGSIAYMGDLGGGAQMTQAISINSTGGGAAHNTMQPFLVTNYIIRATSVTPTKYSLVGDMSPIGSVTAFAGATLPTDWLLCDGSSLLRTDYPELFTVLGTTWGSADATHFNLPDLRGRTLIGTGTGAGVSTGVGGTGLPSGSALTARTLAQWGGEEAHATTVGEMPSHNHGGGDHTHQIATYNNVGAGAWAGGVQGVTGQNQFTGVYAGTIGSGAIITSQGGGSGHNTMQPFAVVTWIIKAKQTVATTTTGNSSKSRVSFTADGVLKTFTLRHTLSLASNEPYIAQVWEADASGNPTRQAIADVVYSDFQNVNVVFGTAPANGKKYILTVIG